MPSTSRVSISAEREAGSHLWERGAPPEGVAAHPVQGFASRFDMSDESKMERFPPSEVRAIREYARTCLCDQPVADDVLIRKWEGGPAPRWRRAKAKRDSALQVHEIEKHKYCVSKERGHDIGGDAAAQDWVSKYARLWREWWETCPDSCPPFDFGAYC